MRFLLLLSLGVAVLCAADRPNFTGAWQWNPAKSELHTARFSGLTWVIDQKDTSVSFWYNGPALVELVSKGHNKETVVKKRMRISDDGKLMNVEYIPMVGSEQPAKLVFEKQ
jgi:hypothetical protein